MTVTWKKLTFTSDLVSNAAYSDDWNGIDAIAPSKNAVYDKIQTLTTPDYVKVSDVKSYSTAGGTFTAGAWRTRDINTEDSDVSGICSIASNQITLAAGTYLCLISCPGYAVSGNKARLYNITDSAEIIIGTNAMAHPSYGGFSRSFITGKFTIAAQKTFEVQHWCIATVATQGFGSSNIIDSKVEVYTVAEFWRVG